MLNFRLEEANDTIEAIRSGNIDGLIVKGEEGHQLYTLKSADLTYRLFIEQMSEGAVTLNDMGIILYCNSKFATLLSLPLESVVGQHFRSFIPTDFEETWDSIFDASWQTNIKTEMSLRGNNIPVDVLLSLKTLSLNDGRTMSIVITDLTEQKLSKQLLLRKNIELEKAHSIAHHLSITLENTVNERTRELKHRTEELEVNIKQKSVVEAMLRSNEERLTRILETMAEGVAIYDENGVITFANLMAQRILGLVRSKEQIFELPAWQYTRLNGTTLPENEYPVPLTIASRKPMYDYEIGVVPTELETIFISVNTAPIFDAEGKKVVSVIATFMDVTHRRKVIQQKDEFISVASHELRTPVTSLKASLQLLDRIKNDPDPELLPVLIEQANKSLNKVSVLIDDLLNSTKMTEGQLHLNKTRFNIAHLVREVSQQILVSSSHHLILQDELETSVVADADKIDQVMVNLINNAVKYGADAKDILVKVEREDGCAKVSVIDNGPGIPPEKLPHLFERYFRVDLNGIQYSGLGLGLYICAQIIKKHEGKIGVESMLGGGSKFWFTLPLSAEDISGQNITPLK